MGETKDWQDYDRQWDGALELNAEYMHWRRRTRLEPTPRQKHRLTVWAAMVGVFYGVVLPLELEDVG